MDWIQRWLTFKNLRIRFWFDVVWVVAPIESTTQERGVIFLVINGPWLLEGDKTGMSSDQPSGAQNWISCHGKLMYL